MKYTEAKKLHRQRLENGLNVSCKKSNGKPLMTDKEWLNFCKKRHEIH